MSCAVCGGVKFDSEGTMMCGDCLLALRDHFGIKMFEDGTMMLKVAPKKWVIHREWRPPTKKKK